ncbi:MAG: response regulator [Hydrogenophaga sp.]|uniref:response regulator transcription factor n=1 Tax=Hydrogenophaga sp. TaxID=1904254 RepID=UPI001D91EDBE|nr:DNA-binding response regulator [Hydrogenophaga sp.]MBX3608987.1 response regulator [Hydrogenophaga sp.]
MTPSSETPTAPTGTTSASASTGVAQPVILVVDDSLDTLRMLGDALVAEGYVVMAARDAQEAIERFEVAIPDGVLLDAVMPGMDGFDLCERIKATPAWSHVPVVFMTGLSESEQILRGFASGGVDYVVKPLRIPEVMARLATHVRNARVARLAQEAVDVAGMGTVLLDSLGRVAWRSPQAMVWLEQAFGTDAAARERAAQWLSKARRESMAGVGLGQGRLHARNLGQGGLGESMLVLNLAPADNINAQHLRDIALTPRETEVLSWLAKGKTNRDIADILGMSHRTVNKHLEHVFEKLGVETRTAAAAMAGKLLPQA